ncbi:MAG: hypothetical protein J7L95_06920 [Prolixibacteraceae bacterium]|nr:hypothetical protein [Prolixibacteraceae bacterium]
MENLYEIPILFRDDHIIVVEKPVDLPVHKNDFMPHDAPYLTKLIGELTGKWIYNVHRLDSKTSGVIVLAFSSEVAHELTLQFERKEVAKTYFALVEGTPGRNFQRKSCGEEKVEIQKNLPLHTTQPSKPFKQIFLLRRKKISRLVWWKFILKREGGIKSGSILPKTDSILLATRITEILH